MLVTYSESAKLRISGQGAARIAAYIDEISPQHRLDAVKALPTVDGFRKNSTAEIKERVKKLVHVLAHAGDAKLRNNEVEWGVLGCIWAFHAIEQFGGSFSLTPKELNEMGADGASIFIDELIRRCGSDNCAKEDVEKLLVFGPFSDNPDVTKRLESLPTVSELEKRREFAALPDKMTALSDLLKGIEARVAGQNDNLQKVATRIDELEKLVKTQAKAPEGLTAELNLLRQCLSKSEEREERERLLLQNNLRGFISAQGESQEEQIEQIASFVREQDLRLTNLAQSLAEIKNEWCAPPPPRSSDTATEVRSSHLGEIGTSPSRLYSVSREWPLPNISLKSYELAHQSLVNNLAAVGLSETDCEWVAHAILVATVSGQLIQFSGSFGELLAEATSVALAGGNGLVWHVPLGLCDGGMAEVAMEWMRADESQYGCLFVKGINRSAFEVYGDELRELVLRRLVGGDECLSYRPLIATWADGPAVLPGGLPLLQLGPLINSDGLNWMRSKWNKQRPGVFDEIRPNELLEMSGAGQEAADLIEAIETMGLKTNQLRKRQLQRTVSLLHLANLENYELASEIMLSAWLIPWAVATGVNKSSLEELIVKSLPEVSESAIVVSSLVALPEELLQ